MRIAPPDIFKYILEPFPVRQTPVHPDVLPLPHADLLRDLLQIPALLVTGCAREVSVLGNIPPPLRHNALKEIGIWIMIFMLAMRDFDLISGYQYVQYTLSETVLAVTASLRHDPFCTAQRVTKPQKVLHRTKLHSPNSHGSASVYNPRPSMRLCLPQAALNGEILPHLPLQRVIRMIRVIQISPNASKLACK